jgi:enoyl-[acyl-carrier protein] reductase II
VTCFGIEKPVFQGGMAWIADASLASAVSNAGGLGIISAMNADAEWLRGQIRAARQATDRPFGVNIMLMSPFADEVAQVVVDEKVPVAITGAGNPTKYMKAWEAAGVKVVPVVASVALARLVERVGATAIVAEGGESGGHVGDLTTMALVPQVVDAVRIPWSPRAASPTAVRWPPPSCWAPRASRWAPASSWPRSAP